MTCCDDRGRITAVEQIPGFLAKTHPAFLDSAEYQRLDPVSRTVPGLFIGQLTLLLRRLQSEALSDDLADESAATLRDTYQAIERLAASPVPDVQNVVIVECLEHLHGSAELQSAILNRLGPASRQLYLNWVEPNLDKG